MVRTLLLLGLVVVGTVNADQSLTYSFSPESLRTDGVGRKVGLICNKDGFSVLDEDGVHPLQRADISQELRGISSAKDAFKYAQENRVRVHRYQDGSYRLSNGTGLKGGGPVLGAVFYGVTKAVIHGAIALGIAKLGAQVSDGRGAAPSATVGMAVGGAADAVTDGIPGASIAAGAIEGAGYTDPAVDALPFTTTVHHVGTAATVAAEVGPIEAICLSAYAVGLRLPGW